MANGDIIALAAIASLLFGFAIWKLLHWQDEPAKPPIRGDDGRFLPGSAAFRDRDELGRFTGDEKPQ